MKRKHLLLSLGTLCLLFFTLSIRGFSQDVDISGSWKGAIELPGMELDIVIEFEKDGKGWKGDIDIPLQKTKDMPLAEVKLEGRRLTFKLPEAPGNANFDGEVSASGEEISGDFNQMGQQFPLSIKQESAAEKEAEARRLVEAEKKFRAIADSLHAKRHVPGYSICIVHKGEVILSDGFGYRDLEKKIKPDAQTMYAIGSSSKAFTAMSLAILADEGKLEWDEPVKTYLPDFKMYDDFATEEMTAMDLLTHRSGLPRHDFMWYGSPATREEIYSRLRYLEPNKSFRSTWQYQNLMYMTAGYLAGKLNGSSWEDLVQKRIFDPLDMKRTNFAVKKMSASDNAALGYRWDRDQEKMIKMDYRDLTAIGPAGSINSTVEDMAAWVKLHLNGGKLGDEEIISNAQLTQMHAPQMVMGRPARGKETTAPSYGMGWMVYQYKSHKVAEHGGNIDGFSAEVWLMPEDEFGMVVLSNANGTPVPTLLCRYATDLFLGLEETDWDARAYGDDEEDKEEKKKEKDDPKEEAEPVKGTKPSHALADFAGTYSHPGYGKMEIKLKDKQLTAHFNGLEFPFTHWHYDVFNGRLEAFDTDMKFTFHGNAAGEIDVVSVPIEPSMDDIEFTKLPPSNLNDPELMKKLVGSYEFKVIKAKVELTPGNKLMLTAAGQNPVELVPWRKTEYKLDGLNGFSIEFIANKKGEFNEVMLHQPNGNFPGERVE